MPAVREVAAAVSGKRARLHHRQRVERQLAQQNFLNIVEAAVCDAKLQPCDLRLEVTETALMDSPHAAATLLRDLRDFGVKIYLDELRHRLFVPEPPAQTPGRRAQD